MDNTVAREVDSSEPAVVPSLRAGHVSPRRRRTVGSLAVGSLAVGSLWEVVRAASERANVRVLALRTSAYGKAGQPAPVHPHLFRHARQIVRTTRSLSIAQKQTGWSRLQLAYLSVSDDEVREALRNVEL
jgi:integrase